MLSVTVGAVGGVEPGDHPRSLTHDGVTRRYLLHIPQSFEHGRPTPLLLDFHGLGSDELRRAGFSEFAALSEKRGFLVAYPRGRFGSWNAGALCCGRARAEDIDDVSFVRALVEAVSEEVPVDRDRIYATGLSNGGAMAHRLACEAADLLAAVAPMAFPIAVAPPATCAPSRPISVLTFMGLSDRRVPYGGTERLPSAHETFRHWRELNGCGTGEPERQRSFGASDCEIDTTCADRVEVGLCSILASESGDGHLLYLNDDVVVEELAWNFLARHSLRGASRRGTPLPFLVGATAVLLSLGLAAFWLARRPSRPGPR